MSSWSAGAWGGGAPTDEEGHGLLDPAEQSDDGMLDELQDELDAAMRAANAALDDCDDSLDAVTYRVRLGVAGRKLDAASTHLQQMKLAARSIGAVDERAALIAALRTTERQMSELRRVFRTEQDRFERASLLGLSASDGGGGGGGGRNLSYQQGASDASRLSHASESLRNSISTVYETTETAARTLEDLHAQRESLLASKSKGKQVLSTAGRARRTLAAMNRQAIINKALIYGVMGLLLCVILILIYFLVFR